jgi:hypothetical protein
MTANDQGALTTEPAPRFSIWSPLVAGAAELSTTFLPGWVTALVFAVGVLCAFPFRQLRVVVPLALLTWGAGWFLSTIFRFTAAGIVGLLVVK